MKIVLITIMGLLFFLVDRVRAQFSNVPTSVTIMPDAHIYQFGAEKLQSPGGTACFVVIKNSDASSQQIILQVLSNGGNVSRMERASLIASRMQMLTGSDPDWCRHLRIAKLDKGETVVIDGTTGQYVMTADRASAQMAGISEPKYAAMIITSIQNRLQGTKLR